MRKIFLSFLALTIAVSASASFTLQLQKKDVVKTISSATPSSDLFSDGGSVAVAFDKTAKTVYVTLKDAVLYNTETLDGRPFFFEGDDSYTKLCIKIVGFNEIICRENTNIEAMFLSKCEVDIISESMNDTLFVISKNHYPIRMNGKTTLNIGNREKGAFYMNLQTGFSNCIYGDASFYPTLNIYSASVYFKTDDDEPVSGFGELNLKYNQPLKYPVEAAGGLFWDKKEEDVYRGSLFVPGPYAIFFGEEPVFVANEDDFQPTSLITEFGQKGTISYDHATKTLTLKGVTIDGNLWIGYDDFTINLEGGNTFRNSAENTDTRIEFEGKNAKIKGAATATLTVYCKSNCDGIHATGGLDLADFDNLEIYASINGIVGNMGEMDKNKLNTNVNLMIYASTKVLADFYDFTYASGMVKSDASTDTYLDVSYPKYFEFYDTDVTAKNASDIVVPGADGKASYDAAKATLTLNNFKSDVTPSGNAINNEQNDLTISLVGSSKLETSADAIHMDHNLTIEGNGTLEVSSSAGNGISLPSEGVLTIKNGADVVVSGLSGVYALASVMCMGGGIDPGDPIEPDGQAATLIINNASLKASASFVDEYSGAVWGFKAVNLTGAKITEPATATAAYMCDGMQPYAGIIDAGAYAQSVTISKTGGAAIDRTNDIKATNKILRDGQLFIQYGDKTYNAQGAEVR